MPPAYGLIEPHDLPVAGLPPVLEGFRVLHVTDLHVYKARPRFDRMVEQLGRVRFDLVALTGDFMHEEGHEDVAMEVMYRLCERLAGVPTFGVFGNHDTEAFRKRAATLPVRWLGDEAVALHDQPMDVLGLDMKSWPGDAVALAQSMAALPAEPGRVRMLLAHTPSVLATASDLGVAFLLCGHTHGGQIRLPTGRAFVNACDLPVGYSSGLLRHRDTLAAVSRGVGEGPMVPRLFCRPHVPLYTLRNQPLPGQASDTIARVRRW